MKIYKYTPATRKQDFLRLASEGASPSRVRIDQKAFKNIKGFH